MKEADRGRRGRRSMQEKYEAFASEAAGRLRAEVLGTDVVNGYTTLQQADQIASALALTRGDRLLDLGGGRGWPGSHVARASGCRLVVCDLPMNALTTARAILDDQGLEEGLLVRADGRRLPFRDATYDGICHTDVLC
ncbi:MAG: methyltransferase domain-containing protein [Longimicrobiales bacterium]|nr:methyltransferase domain-containing protein [Longimicrobiales bacterium]